MTESTRALCVGLAFGNPFPIEIGHLLDQIMVVQNDRPVTADGQRMLVALNTDAAIGGGGGSAFAFVDHDDAPFLDSSCCVYDQSPTRFPVQAAYFVHLERISHAEWIENVGLVALRSSFSGTISYCSRTKVKRRSNEPSTASVWAVFAENTR